MKVTTSPGALVCLHMIHGMPMLVPMAICAAQLMYLVPSSLNAASKCWYSFSIWQEIWAQIFCYKGTYTYNNQRIVRQARPKRQKGLYIARALIIIRPGQKETSRGCYNSFDCLTCARMMGPPCDAKRLASLSLFITIFTNVSMCICVNEIKRSRIVNIW